MIQIIKIGGNLINDKAVLQQVLTDFSEIKTQKILVHGGGRKASELSRQMGISPNMINGRRITDAATLEIVTMVYAGLLNKQIVADLQSLNCNTLGMSGADINAIQSHKRIVKEIDYGFVGDVDNCNATQLFQLLGLGITPVFCAITHDKQGQLLNTNADTIASTLAIALSKHDEVHLKFLFEKPGVLLDANDDNSLIPIIDNSYYSKLKTENIIFDGMLPKIDNAFAALAQGVNKVFIGKTVIQ